MFERPASARQRGSAYEGDGRVASAPGKRRDEIGSRAAARASRHEGSSSPPSEHHTPRDSLRTYGCAAELVQKLCASG